MNFLGAESEAIGLSRGRTPMDAAMEATARLKVMSIGGSCQSTVGSESGFSAGSAENVVISERMGGAAVSASLASMRLQEKHRGRGQSPPPVDIPKMYLNKMASIQISDNPTQGPPSARGFDRMLSTPRRRLRDALNMEKQICEQLLSTGWVLAVRAGKKIDGRYGLVSAYSKFPDIRVTVYQTQTSQLQELFFQHPTNLADMDSRSRKQVVFKFIDTLVFNGVGMLVPRPSS